MISRCHALSGMNSTYCEDGYGGGSNPDSWQLSYFTSTTRANKPIPWVEQSYEMSKSTW